MAVDPISITTGIVALVSTATKLVSTVNDYRQRYRNSCMILPAIAAECNLMSLGLQNVQDLFCRNQSKYLGKEDLLRSLENTLTGCGVIVAVLEKEVGQLWSAEDERIRRGTKLRFLWNETTMRDLLQQARAQQSGITLLLAILQAESMDNVLDVLQANKAVLDRLAKRAHSVGDSYSIRTRSAFYPEGHDTDTLSILSDVTSTRFNFDDAVVNSEAYRRALRQAQATSALARIESSENESAGSIGESSSMSQYTGHGSNPAYAIRRKPIGTATFNGATPPAMPVPLAFSLARSSSSITTAEYLDLTFSAQTETLSAAVREGNLSLLGELLTGGVGILAHSSTRRLPLLHQAVQADQPQVCSLLLSAGADGQAVASCRLRNGEDATMSAISLAAATDRMGVLQTLLEANVNPNRSKNSKLHSPLFWAVSNGSAEGIKMLLDHGADPDDAANGVSAIECAAGENSVTGIQILVERGARLDALGPSGRSPLHTAAMRGNSAAIGALIRAGADPNLKDSAGLSPLHRAAMWSQSTSVAALRLHGIEIDVGDKDGATPLHYAARYAQGPVIGQLLDAGAELNLLTKTGGSPLFFALWNKDAQSFKYLIEKGAQVNMDLTFHLACAAPERIEHARLLIESGADVNIMDSVGKTPLVVAVLENHVDGVKLLLNSGANAYTNTFRSGALNRKRGAIQLAKDMDVPEKWRPLRKKMVVAMKATEGETRAPPGRVLAMYMRAERAMESFRDLPRKQLPWSIYDPVYP